MFKKILIANRGAIACRILRTVKRMGIGSVAVYSEADENSMHVRQADEAHCIGPAPAAESYLRGERILEVALASGAEGIHPGYGFLSENADFAQLCEDAGVAFIGPTPEQMRNFGLKHTARELAGRAELPLLPGTDLLADLPAALAAAERIGYPVMLKSTAGGGGIGMRRCNSAQWECVARGYGGGFGRAAIASRHTCRLFESHAPRPPACRPSEYAQSSTDSVRPQSESRTRSSTAPPVRYSTWYRPD